MGMNRGEGGIEGSLVELKEEDESCRHTHLKIQDSSCLHRKTQTLHCFVKEI